MTPEQAPEHNIVFGAELQRRRKQRGLSVRALGRRIRYHYAHVSNVENGNKPATREFAAACDRALDAGGALIKLWSEHLIHVRVAQLPAALANLIGRSDELRGLNEVVTGTTNPGVPRVVVVDGSAGVGKTSLVVTWAHRVASQFPDGTLFVDLCGFGPDGQDRLRPADVLERFLVALGAGSIPDDLRERAALYRTMLAERQLLVVLDNAADAAQIEPLLPGSPGCAVAVTSRERLVTLAVRTAATRITLGPLDDADAAVVLAAVLGDERVAAEPEATHHLVRMCGGLPLALRLAAERICAVPHHRVTDLVDELRSSCGTSRPSALPDELVSLHRVISWSYLALDRREAALFRYLGLHPGRTISPAAAAVLVGISPSTARILLSRLTGLHVVEAISPESFRMHDLVWSYAAGRARQEIPADEQSAAVKRFTAWYLHTAWAAARTFVPSRTVPDSIGPAPTAVPPMSFASRAQALQWCDTEVHNFASVVRQAAEHGLNTEAAQLAIAVSDYFSLRRHWDAWEQTHTAARHAARKAHDTRAECVIFIRLAEAARLRQDFPQSWLLSAAALAAARGGGDRHGEALAMVSGALVAVECGQFDLGERLAARAHPTLVERADDQALAIVLGVRGQAAVAVGRRDAARAVLAEALARFDALGSVRGRGWVLRNIAAVDVADGDPETGLGALNDAVAAFSRAEDRWNVAYTLVIRGDQLAGLGRIRQAHRSWRSALAFYQQVGDRRASQLAARLAGSTDTASGGATEQRDADPHAPCWAGTPRQSGSA